MAAKDNVKEITEQLEQGVKDLFASDKYAEYLSFMGRFYNYSAGNCLLIWLQNPSASLVAGYKAWQTKFKRQVKKGEKGIKILAPCPHKITKTARDEDGNLVEKELRWTTFRAVSVFDVSQTEGEDIPEIVSELTGDVDGYEELVAKLTALSPVPVGYEDIQDGAKGYYNPVEKRIAIKTGMPESQTVKTLVHEISHAILHNRESGEEKDANRRAKEVQAESVAYTVCSALGLDTADYSFGYVAGWSEGKDVKELSASMDIIRKTAEEIIEGVSA